MRPVPSKPTYLQQTTPLLQLLALGLAAMAVAFDRQVLSTPLLALGAGYLVSAVVLRVLAARLAEEWVAYAAPLVDVVAITAFVALAPVESLPVWLLYLFPLSHAAGGGRVVVALTGGASTASLLAVTWQATGTVRVSELWAAAILIAATLAAIVLLGQGELERRREHAWRRVLGAAQALLQHADVDAVADTVVERARGLAGAERAWLWWCDDQLQLRPGPWTGGRDAPAAPSSVAPADVERLDRAPKPLAELDSSAADQPALVVVLRHGARRVAVLGVAWGRPQDQLDQRLYLLRLFAPWAARALDQALARAAEREAVRRESVLRRAAVDVAATLEPEVVQRVVVRAAEEGLGVSACLVDSLAERPSLDYADAAETDSGHVRGAPPAAHAGTDAGAPHAVRITEQLSLLVWGPNLSLDSDRLAWLDRLANLARGAMERSSEHQHLVAAERRLRASLEAVPAPVVIWEQGAELLANAAYRSAGLHGTRPPDLPPGAVREEELVVGTPPRTFVVATAQLPEGQCVAVYREITREREALRAKEELMALVGHELRTPLTSIHGYSQLMNRQLRVVGEQVDQLNRLIGDLLHAARLDSAPLSLDRKELDLAEVTHAAADRFRARQEGRALRLDVSSVPTVEGDPSRLAQVLDNLLDNAARYSPPEEEITVRVEQSDDRIVVSVEDRGIGIADAHLPQVFDRFYRVPGAATERVKGLGLGLSIVRDLVSAHGGSVWAESEGPGKGSVFRVALPVARSTEQAAGEPNEIYALPGSGRRHE